MAIAGTAAAGVATGGAAFAGGAAAAGAKGGGMAAQLMGGAKSAAGAAGRGAWNYAATQNPFSKSFAQSANLFGQANRQSPGLATPEAGWAGFGGKGGWGLQDKDSNRNSQQHDDQHI